MIYMGTDKRLFIRVTDEERNLIEQKMALAGISNMSAYIRKMAIDGYILKLELPELKEIAALLGRVSGNMNQIAKRANASGRIYETDLQDIKQRQDEMTELTKKVYRKLLQL